MEGTHGAVYGKIPRLHHIQGRELEKVKVKEDFVVSPLLFHLVTSILAK